MHVEEKVVDDVRKEERCRKTLELNTNSLSLSVFVSEAVRVYDEACGAKTL